MCAHVQHDVVGHVDPLVGRRLLLHDRNLPLLVQPYQQCPQRRCEPLASRHAAFPLHKFSEVCCISKIILHDMQEPSTQKTEAGSESTLNF